MFDRERTIPEKIILIKALLGRISEYHEKAGCH